MKDKIQTALIFIILFFASLFLYTKFAGPLPFYITSVVTNKNDYFSVTGDGRVDVKPDIATVNAGVQVKALTQKEAQDLMNGAINKVTAAIKDLGIDPKDIKTENLNVSPSFDYPGGVQRQSGYQANTNISIKVRELSKVNQVIDTATQNGANVVSGAQFEVEDKSKYEQEARKLAVEDAKRKATQAATTAGFDLGKLINYQENLEGDQGGVMALKEGVPQGGTQVESGTAQVKMTVTLGFEVK